jgi:hypothetical protein
LLNAYLLYQTVLGLSRGLSAFLQK